MKNDLEIRDISGYSHYVLETLISLDMIDDFYSYTNFGEAPYKTKKYLLQKVSEHIDFVILNHREEGLACTRFIITEKTGRCINVYQNKNKGEIERQLGNVKII